MTRDPEADRLNAIFNQAPTAICVLEGPEHRYIVANQRHQEFVGNRNLVGKTVAEVFSADTVRRVKPLLDGVRESGKPYVGTEVWIDVPTADGSGHRRVCVDFVYQPILKDDQTVDAIFSHSIDVTERVNARQEAIAAADALRISEQRLRESLEVSGAGVWEVDLAKNEVLTDAHFDSMHGVTGAMHSAAGDNRLPFDVAVSCIYPDDRAIASTGVGDALAGRDSGRYDADYRTGPFADGTVRWVAARGQAYFDDAGRPLRFLGTCVDITQRKNAEAERSAILRSAALVAEEASHLKDDFIAIVSHELRTPLTAILGWVQMLRAGHVPQERTARVLETIERNARTQNRLVEDLLDISRITSGKLRLEVETLSLAPPIEAALESLKPAAVARNITIEVALDTMVSVRGDAVRLQQIAWNLIANAIKFTAKGGQVRVMLERHDALGELVVSDNGQGIAREFLPHVFERFRQAEDSSTRRHGGLGLGLAIAKHLVDLHGGVITAESAGVGHGATFRVRLPLAPGAD